MNGAQGRVADTNGHSSTSIQVRANTAPLNGKGNNSSLPNPSTEFPLIVAAWDRNAREIVRVALDRYQGRHTIDVRTCFRDGDQVKPSRSGITLAVKNLPALADALGKALIAARELGLLDAGGEQ